MIQRNSMHISSFAFIFSISHSKFYIFIFKIFNYISSLHWKIFHFHIQEILQYLERGRWLDCTPQQKQFSEGGHIHGKTTNSSGLEKNEKVLSDYWTHQPTISSCSGSGGPFNKSDG